MSGASPFNPRLMIGLIVAGTAAFAALLLLIAFGGNVGSQRDGRGHALSVSAIGFQGLVTLVGSRREVRFARDAQDLTTEDLLVVAIEPHSRAEAIARLIASRRGRATLFILPKWATMADPDRPGWVLGLFAGIGAGPARTIGGVDARLAGDKEFPRTVAATGILEGLRVPVPRSPQLAEGKAVNGLATLVGDGALVARLGDQPHYLVADPDLLNNHGLKDPIAARTAVAMIDRMNSTGARGVAFDLTVNGLAQADGRNLLRLAFEPPFLAMTLALVIAALLAGLHGAFRFGPVRRPERAIALGKTALVENSAGLIRRAGREARLGAAFVEMVRQDVARAVHAPPRIEADALDAWLDRIGRSRGSRAQWSELAGSVVQARDRRALVAAARALVGWKKDVVG